jgi:hypothetical protein
MGTFFVDASWFQRLKFWKPWEEALPLSMPSSISHGLAWDAVREGFAEYLF